MRKLGRLHTVAKSALKLYTYDELRLKSNLEDHDIEEHEEDASSIPSFVLSADILPLKEGFGQ